MWGMIATWNMARDGVKKAEEILANHGSACTATEVAIIEVENNPAYTSVGYGAQPNEEGLVELDAAYMDGDNFNLGAIAGASNIKNPISVAKKLSEDTYNIFLVGKGATKYAEKEGFELSNMLTEKSRNEYTERLKEIHEKDLSPYDGHDTVGVVALDAAGKMVTGTSTSGLFMKKTGRIGDSALSGSGFYVDSEIGGATATGLGEDLMKGCVSYEIVRLMGEGLSPEQACKETLRGLTKKLTKGGKKARAWSVIAMNNKGEWGVATNVEFSFVVATKEQETTVYTAHPAGDGCTAIKIAEAIKTAES